MPVRVKLRIRSRTINKEVETSAVINTSFMSNEPDFVIPIKLAQILGIWPIKEKVEFEEVFGAIGQSYMLHLRQVVDVKLIEEDYESSWITCNVLISEHEDEVLISDYLTEEFGIQILHPRSGILEIKE